VFDHKNFALNGLYPGMTSTRSIANLGHFEVEVTIEPVGPGFGGGGYYEPYSPSSTKYKVKMRITRKGKTWEYEQIVGSTTAKIIAKVIKVKVAEPAVSVINTSMVSNPEVKVKVNVNR
jgi:hypothetical protein